MSEHLVIVGGGQAAAQAVQSLRQQSFAGADHACSATSRIRRISGRRCRRNTSPASSRANGLLLRPAAFYAEKGVTLEQNARVEELDAAARRVRLRDGRTLAYDRLLLATGSRVRSARRAGHDAARRALPAHDRRRRRHHGVARAPARACCSSAPATSASRSRPSRGSAASTSRCSKPPSASCRARSASRSPRSTRACHRAAGVVIHCGAAVKALHGTTRVTAVETTRRPHVPVRRRDRRHRHRAQRRARGRRGARPAATASSSTSSRARPIRTSSRPATARTIRSRCSSGACASNPCRTRFTRPRLPPRRCSARRRRTPRCRGSGPTSTT